MEVWKDIPNFEGKYQISDHGNIYSTRYNRHRKLRIDRSGYPVVALNKDGKQHFFLVHRLVAEVFMPNPDLKPEINHIDGNKQNNHIENLEWVSHKENIEHAYETGLFKSRKKKSIAKKDSVRDQMANRKLTIEQVKQIRSEYKNGVCGYKVLAKKYNVNRMTIKSIILGKTYKETK